MSNRITDQHAGWRRRDDTEVGRVEDRGRGPEAGAADDRNTALTDERPAAQEPLPISRNRRHVARYESRTDTVERVRALKGDRRLQVRGWALEVGLSLRAGAIVGSNGRHDQVAARHQQTAQGDAAAGDALKLVLPPRRQRLHHRGGVQVVEGRADSQRRRGDFADPLEPVVAGNKQRPSVGIDSRCAAPICIILFLPETRRRQAKGARIHKVVLLDERRITRLLRTQGRNQ